MAGEEPTSAINADVEIVMTFPRPTCPKPPNFPKENSLSLIGTFLTSMPILCGGGETSIDNFCYGFDFEEYIWINKSFKLDQSRIQAAGTQISDNKWIIFGGQIYFEGGPLILNTSTILVNEDFLPGPYLPMPLAGLCAVSIETNKIFLSGGNDGQLKKQRTAISLLLKTSNLPIWKNLPMMSIGRYGHSCGKTKHFNEFEIIVAGGLRVNRVEIYLLTKGLWINGPNLERQVFSAATLQGELTFLIIGGMELEPDCKKDNCRLDVIHAYNRLENSWNEKKQTLRLGRRNHVAIPLPIEVDCSSKLKLSLLVKFIWYSFTKLFPTFGIGTYVTPSGLHKGDSGQPSDLNLLPQG